MINFTNCITKNKGFGGANGKKISIEYDGELYMLKFPTTGKINKDMHYTNGCISEYIGCHIFNEIGIKAQETLLGIYETETSSGKNVKMVVACKDFTNIGIIAQDFASLKNRIIDSERNGYGKELSDILYTIEEQTSYPVQELMEYFWNVFIIDALIGNWDRHNGNWGFLYHQQTDKIEISPIYDCGSSLYPQADETIMKSVLNNENEMKRRVFERPTSSIEINGERINYYNFLYSCEYEECNRALIRIFPRINLDKINQIIEQTEGISELHKTFLKTMLKKRYELILEPSYKKAKKIIKQGGEGGDDGDADGTSSFDSSSDGSNKSPSGSGDDAADSDDWTGLGEP